MGYTIPMLRYVYTILFYLILPGVFLRLLWRSRHNPEYRHRWLERLGFGPRMKKSIWIHAASVGETLAAIPLVKSLQQKYPGMPVIITNMTITGGARARAAFGDTVTQAYIPYDLPGATARFIQRCNPVIAIIMETELWPNLFYQCRRHKVPVLVANARLSEKSARGYKKIAGMTREMLTAVTTLAVQSQVEANRFTDLGLAPAKVQVSGSIKFDVEVPAEVIAKSEILRAQLGNKRFIWIAASTHATEEEIVLSAHKQILAKLPDTLLILVPRHPQRFDEIYKMASVDFKVARRSKNEICELATQVYLGDTMGEMLLMYAVCDIALVAGSFAPLGGHNILEAAVLGKPVITGPILFNFAEISEQLTRAGGMSIVNNADELATEIIGLLQDDARRIKMGEDALKFLNANRGAVAKHVDFAAKIIETPN
jgi:3-deoxy-D-manno-octulosonic-acid transferase